ncbi:hypothetical protein [Candidatus Clostridium stratigraminis]|uniref:Lipoprotein n=1 Tax=Candidatus Clostridium stratigraminis TaxID=3381661 RepID=A0ABW8T9T2_9CLOT
MKKIIYASISIFLVLTFASCTTKNVAIKNVTAENVTTNKSDSTDIKFEYFYRGFATMHDNEMDTYPSTLIIQTDEDWHDFMDKYVPGIPYNVAIDFSKVDLSQYSRHRNSNFLCSFS